MLSVEAAAAAKSLQSCPTLCDPIDGSPPGSPRPWDSPGKNTGVAWHFLLRCSVFCCVKFLATPWTVDRQTSLSMELSREEHEWVAISFSRGFSGSRDQTCISFIGCQILYHWVTSAYILGHSVMSYSFVTPWIAARQAPLSIGILQTRILEWIAMPSSRGSSPPRNWTQVSCIAGKFFTAWATREAL